MRCPVGIIDKDEHRRPHPHHTDCSNGFLYTLAGSVTTSFSSNNKSTDTSVIGFVDSSTVQVTFPRFYDQCVTDECKRPLEVAPFDRFYLNEESIVVPHWQLVEYSQTGKDRLQFPAVRVTDLVDARGIRYQEGTDFEVFQGQIYWLTQNRPGYDAEHDKGVVYSVRFLYRPYWYLSRMMHEVRVSQVEKVVDSKFGRHIERMPQEAMLQREYIFEKEDVEDPDAPHNALMNPDSPRHNKGPGAGSFGPR